ncbi:Lcl C-terminal domain-containing protein [Parabacteroides sp.]
MLKELSTCVLYALLLLPIAGCQDDLPDKQEGIEEKGTITLTFTAEPGRMVQTKSEVRPSTPGSEADKAGFSYEMVVTSIDSISPDTKANPVSFKNGVALLFNGDTFNGRAEIGDFQGGVPLTVTFTGVTTPNATNCRLVLVADDKASTANLASTSALKSFSGTYSTFCTTSPTIDATKVTQDADIPYVGSVTISSISSSNVTVSSLPLYRMLGKVSVSTPQQDPSGLTLLNISIEKVQYKPPFGTTNEYDGSGSNEVVSGQGINSPQGSRSYTFYAGESIRNYTATSIKDRNYFNASGAPCLIFTFSGKRYQSSLNVGEEYISAANIFIYVYLGNGEVSDFSFRRNHTYDVTVNVSGSFEELIAQSTYDKRIRIGGSDHMTHHAGLCVGRLGGFVATANGTDISDVKGHYTKMLLLEPNNSREVGVADSKTYVWNASPGSSMIQTDARRFWDYSYIKSLSGQGGMSDVSGSAYNYCKTLTLGDVAAGTWYVPTVRQLAAIRAVLAGMQDNPVFGYYSAFLTTTFYWSSSENNATYVWTPNFYNGYNDNRSKSTPFLVRCVRDL